MLRFTFKNKRYRLNLIKFTRFISICTLIALALIFMLNMPKPANAVTDTKAVKNTAINESTSNIVDTTTNTVNTIVAKITKEIKQKSEPKYTKMPIYSNTSVKRYMDRAAVTNTGTLNYKLCNIQGEGCYDGTVEVDGRKLIALGQEYGTTGDKFDIVLKKDNGETHTVKCIIGDNKKYQDTQNGAGYVATDGTTIEVIVDTYNLNSMSKTMGDMNYTECFEGTILEINKL